VKRAGSLERGGDPLEGHWPSSEAEIRSTGLRSSSETDARPRDVRPSSEAEVCSRVAGAVLLAGHGGCWATTCHGLHLSLGWD
jgi:hypothetical protein